MIKYLDMENATLELKLKSISDYKKFISNNMKDIIKMNFKRIIFNISENKMLKLIELLNNKSIYENILVMINSNCKQGLNNINKNILIINTNPKNIIVENNIYNKIDLKNSNISIIKKCIQDNINIIINPMIDYKNITKSMEYLNDFLSANATSNINLDGFLIPSFLMREHPCNAYLCNGWKCKKNISGLPKKLFIDSNHNVYPHDLIYNRFRIGNVRDTKLSNLLGLYYKSDEYKIFIDYNRKVFIKYLSKYPFNLMPLIEFIKKEVEEND